MLLIILLTSISYAKDILPYQLNRSHQIRVAVIDTGLSIEGIPLCNEGHISFVPNESIIDRNGHGNNISSLINKYANNTNYCQMIIKYFGQGDNFSRVRSSFEHAAKYKADIINFSSGGLGYELKEKDLLIELVKKKILIVVAAGNESENLDVICSYFPACYPIPQLIVVGNISKSTNYGSVVDIYTNGNNQLAGGALMSGTSQSTAIITGRIIHGDFDR